MEMTYSTRRKVKRSIIVSISVVVALTLLWVCWLVWLDRYMVFTRDGAILDFEQAAQLTGSGQLAVAPTRQEAVDIYYHDGEELLGLDTSLRQIRGYYISTELLTATDTDTLRTAIAALPVGSTVMLEVKNIKGQFHYSSGITDAPLSTTVDVEAVDAFIDDLLSRNLYLVASVPAFRDRSYALEHTNIGLPFIGGGGALWLDSTNCYWLDPAKSRTVDYLTKIANELRLKGFDEVMFTDFCFPATDQLDYPGDRAAVIQSVADTLVNSCANERFAVSFLASGSTVQNVEGRSRLYLTGVATDKITATADSYHSAEPAAGLVFLTDSMDTRYEEHSVLRPLEMMLSQ